jgi:pyrroloquinoline-quinone synthase
MPGTGALDAVIHRRHLLKHPFYVAWSRGELTMPVLREYAKQYYHFERAFPQYVAGAYARLSDPVGRRVLLENLIDEEGRDPTHPELWLQFANAIGVKRNAVQTSRPRPSTRALLGAYERMALSGTAPEALGALYAYESIFPEIAAEKSRGLREFYGVNDPKAHEFFRVHTEADVAHSAAERELLARALRGRPSAQAGALRGVDRSLDGWWTFLDSFTPKKV